MAQIDTVVLHNIMSFLEKLDQTGIRISRAYVFGSYAKGKADEWSDIDVAVVSPQLGNDRLEERIRLTELAIAIDDRLEPLPFNVNSFNDDDPLVREIKLKGIVIK